MKIIILNGPPGCGKDTLANGLVDASRGLFIKVAFAYPLKQANKVIYSLTEEELYNYETDRQLKEAPQKRFFGKSWRQVNIDLAEKYLKQEHGRFALGALTAYRLKNLVDTNPTQNFIISDCGFIEEIDALLEHFSPKDITLVQIYRDDCNFNIDSRSYIEPRESQGIEKITLFNNHDRASFVDLGISVIKDIIS